MQVAAPEGESAEVPSGSSRTSSLLSHALQAQPTAPVPTVAKGTGVGSFVEDAPGTSTVVCPCMPDITSPGMPSWENVPM